MRRVYRERGKQIQNIKVQNALKIKKELTREIIGKKIAGLMNQFCF